MLPVIWTRKSRFIYRTTQTSVKTQLHNFWEITLHGYEKVHVLLSYTVELTYQFQKKDGFGAQRNYLTWWSYKQKDFECEGNNI